MPRGRAGGWLRWCLYTPRRTVGVMICAAVALFLIGHVTAAASHRTARPGATIARTPRTPRTTASPAVPDAPITSLGSSMPASAATSSPPPGAAATATRFAAIWTDHQLDRAAWWRALQPLLTPAMARGTAAVDPAEIPATAVTGAATIAAGPGLVVRVPTDAGGLLVRLDPTGTRVDGVAFDTPGN